MSLMILKLDNCATKIQNSFGQLKGSMQFIRRGHWGQSDVKEWMSPRGVYICFRSSYWSHASPPSGGNNKAYFLKTILADIKSDLDIYKVKHFKNLGMHKLMKMP